MGGFGVKHYDGNEHCFSLLSPEEEDLSVSRKHYLPFDKGDYVLGGSCGGLLYFHGNKGKIVIVNSTTNESIVVPPPDFDPLPHESEMRASGLGYDAKSGDYKVIRHYVLYYLDKPDEDGKERYCGRKEFFELYGFKSFGSWKELRRPRYHGLIYKGTGVYVGETGSCYWVGCNDSNLEEYSECLTTYEQLLQQGTEFDGSVASLFMHVVSFDFATESFSQFPLPATAMGLNIIHKLVRYCGSLGALVFDTTCARMPVELYVWKGKGRLWKRVYDVVYIEDAEIPVGLKDDRLFLEAKPSGGRSQLMAYDFDTEQSKKLNIYNYDNPRRMSVVSYGAESTDPPLPDSIPKANYDFSRKILRMSNTGKAKAKKRSGKGKKSRR